MLEANFFTGKNKVPIPAGRWVKLADFPLAYLANPSACADGDYIYTFGGLTTGFWGGAINDVYRYNIPDNRWERLVTTGTKPPARKGSVIFVSDGHLVVWGGEYISQDYFRDRYQLNLETLVWSKQGNVVPSINEPGFFFTTASHPTRPSMVHLFGSRQQPGYYRMVGLNGVVQETISMPSGLWKPAATFRDNVGFIVGGATGPATGNGTASNSASIIDIESGVRELIAPLPIAVVGNALGIIDEFLYSYGGGPNVASAAYLHMQAYSLVDKTWTRLLDTQFVTPGSKIAAAGVNHQNKLYVIGGRDTAKSFFAYEHI